MRGKIIALLPVSVLIIILFIVQFIVVTRVPNDVVEFHFNSTQEDKIQLSHLRKFRQSRNEVVSGIATEFAHVYTKSGSGSDVAAFYVDQYFKSVYPFQIRTGAFLTTGNHIVISTNLATELYRTADATGFELLMGNERYTVAGVYESDCSVMDHSYGMERVYLSIGSDEGREVDVISFSGENTIAFYERQWNSSPTPVKLLGYTGVNFQSRIHEMFLLDKIIFALFFIFFLYKAIRKYMGRVKKMRAHFRLLSESYYRWQVIRRSVRQILSLSLFTILLFLVSALGIWLIILPMKLEPNVIPENVFHISYYLDEMISLFSIRGKALSPISYYYSQYLSAAYYICLIDAFLIGSICLSKFLFRYCGRGDRNVKRGNLSTEICLEK